MLMVCRAASPATFTDYTGTTTITTTLAAKTRTIREFTFTKVTTTKNVTKTLVYLCGVTDR
jgi:hypothetical protein